VRKFLSIFGGVLLALVSLPFLLVALWGVVFGSPTAALLAFVVWWLLFPLFNNLKPIRLLKFSLSFLVIPAALALAPMMMGEVDRRVEELDRKLRSNPDGFTFIDKAGVYGLNIVMGLAAYPVYPEASRETMLMVFPAGRADRRVFYSRFALGSDRVRGRLKQFVKELDETDTSRIRDLGPATIEWDVTEYRLTNPEARYGLALNQTRLYAHAERQGRRWRIQVRHEVEIKYPKDLYVTLVTRPRLRMQEGLFWMLQQYGWLHPYVAEWRFTVYSDDPRLRT